MPTVTTSAPVTFDIGPFQTVSLIAPSWASGTIRFESLAPALKSDAAATLKTQTYGPFGVPMRVYLASTSGEWTYTVGNVDSVSPLSLGVLTWEQLQAAYPNGGAALAALPTGVNVVVTGIGKNVCWMTPNSAKTRWLPVNGQHVLWQVAGSLSAPFYTWTSTGQLSISGGNIEIPASLMMQGDQLWTCMRVRKRGTAATSGVVFRLGTAGTTSDQGVSFATVANANNRDAWIFDLAYVSSTTRFTVGNTLLPNNQATAVSSDKTASVNFEALMYVSIDCSSLTAPDELDLISADVAWRAAL